MEKLKQNVSAIASGLSKEAGELAAALVDLGQGHIFKGWDAAAASDEQVYIYM